MCINNNNIVDMLRAIADNEQLDISVSLPVEIVEIIRHDKQECRFDNIAISSVIKYLADMAE